MREGKAGKNATTVCLQGVEWQYLSSEGRTLLEELPEKNFSGEIVKTIPKRQVVRRPEVFLKEVRYRGWAAILKTIWGGTACLEGRISRRLAECDIAVPKVLAFGAEKKNGFIRRDILLTREEAGAKSMVEVIRGLYPAWPIREKILLAEEFATFMKRLHNSGVSHADLHIGNILWVPEKERRDRFVLLDTDRVSLKNRPLSKRERIDNLALLLSNLWVFSSRSQRFRFLRAYGVCLEGKGRRFVAELEKKALRHSQKTWRKKAQQCLCNNRRFSKKKRNGFTVFFRKKAGIEELLDGLLPDPDRLLEKGQIYKAGNTVRAARIEFNGKSYFLKRFNCKGWSYRLKNAFRRSRAVRSWQVSSGFRNRSLPVPEPLICLEERRMRLLGRSYILFEFVDKTEPLSGVWPRLDSAEKKGILARLAIIFGRQHLSGCVHGDLKWNNILVRGNGEGGLYLTDLDGCKIVGSGKLRSKRKDLERFLLDLAKSESDDKFHKFFLKCWERWSSFI